MVILDGWKLATNIATWLDGSVAEDAKRQITRHRDAMESIGPFWVDSPTSGIWCVYTPEFYTEDVVHVRKIRAYYRVARFAPCVNADNPSQAEMKARDLCKILNNVYFGRGPFTSLETKNDEITTPSTSRELHELDNSERRTESGGASESTGAIPRSSQAES